MHRHDQHPLLSARSLVHQGLTPNDIRAQLKEGQLRRVRRGLYAVDDIPDPEERHRRLIAATMLAVNDTTVVSHVSAGVLLGLPVPRSEFERVSVIRRTPGHGKHGDRLLVRRTRLADDEITVIDGIPVTTAARTVLDLARTSSFAHGVMAADAALHGELVTPEDLATALMRHPRAHGAVRARSVLRFADGRAESPAESLSRVTMAAAGLPAPQLQVELFDENGEFVARPDFLWEDLRLVGEVDGRVKYGDLLRPGQTVEDVVMNERHRDERLRQLGYWPMHWDYATAKDQQALATVIRRGMSVQARRLGS